MKRKKCRFGGLVRQEGMRGVKKGKERKEKIEVVVEGGGKTENS